VDRIGDLVLSTPFLRNVRECFSAAEIVLLGRGFARELLAGGAWVDRIVTFDRKREAEILQGLSSEGFDLAVDLHYDHVLTTARLARRVRARCSVGFDIGGRGALFDVPVPAEERKHFIDETLDILRTLGRSPRRYPPQIHLPPSAYDRAREMLSRQGVGGRYAVFHPGGFYPEQRWPAPRFARLADLTAGLGLTPVFIGGKDDDGLVREIVGSMTAGAASLCGQEIGLSAAAIARSALFVGNNSGPLHIACALDVPTVSTMGPTDAVRFWPVSDRASVLRATRVDDIPLDRMVAAVLKVAA
jgi:ADP-heptose:LPS heptosyltransferase